MGHEGAHGDRLPKCRGNLELLDVFIDVGIEIDLSLLHELHEGGPGEELRGRADAEETRDRIDGCLLRVVGVAVAAGVQEAAILHDGDDGSLHVLHVDELIEGAVEVGTEGDGVVEGAGSEGGLRRGRNGGAARGRVRRGECGVRGAGRFLRRGCGGEDEHCSCEGRRSEGERRAALAHDPPLELYGKTAAPEDRYTVVVYRKVARRRSRPHLPGSHGRPWSTRERRGR